MNWEYKLLQISLAYNTEQITSVVNKDGNQGWELVAVIPTGVSPATASKMLLFFKRPKS